ncbi:ABC transporter substrate-binding protein [Agaricicola taiwanensis]|uniref:ABC transporter substrate-binding protein n=1 Tax=Agaricicola taiwanensis TaxID=591372 RepID=A0A8J3DWT0_9RHOB|nr:ABC transporter substrate-binding protein [Agaricicola taiwanensis]GGE50263.1 ABC transporter substrate-binding protein [Agaricicola taiwanensis]
MRQYLMISALASALAVPLAGTALAEDLKLAISAEVTSLDPHFHNVSSNNQFMVIIYESLVRRNRLAQLEPSLAESWKSIDDNTWEFKLRPGVKFTNGSDFAADDVAFSINRVSNIPNSPGSYAQYTSAVKEVVEVDPLTVRITTKAPDPLLPLNLTAVFMLDKQTHEGATTDQFNSGEKVIGTGPFKVASYRPKELVDLEANENYWGGKPAWDKVSYRMITNDAARVAALLSGDVQFIDQVPASNVPKLKQNENLVVATGGSLRSMYLMLDRSGKAQYAKDNSGKVLPKNPFDDLRVRQALSMAIGRDMIIDRIMEGMAIASGQVMPEGASGHVPEIAVPKYDPEGAKKLLAEAGFPDGFQLTLHGSNGQYPNDTQIVQAVAQMWQRIGLKMEVNVSPFASFVKRAADQEFSAFLASWGTSNGDASSPLKGVLATYDKEKQMGSANRSRYSNPELDAVIVEAMQTVDAEKRNALYQQATKMAMEDVAIIPLLTLKNINAMQKTLSHEPRLDGYILPQEIKPAPATAAK